MCLLCYYCIIVSFFCKLRFQLKKFSAANFSRFYKKITLIHDFSQIFSFVQSHSAFSSNTAYFDAFACIFDLMYIDAALVHTVVVRGSRIA